MGAMSPFLTPSSRARRFVAATAWLALLLAPVAACAFPWDIDMYRGAAVQPLSRAPRVMPSDTMPVDRGEPPASVEESGKLANPLSVTADSLAHGGKLYATNCAPCHGASGTGDGTVVHLLHQKPRDLLGSEAKALSDGYIYGVIRDGFQLMPSYGDAMSSAERWQVVLYVRSLQQGTASGASTAQK